MTARSSEVEDLLPHVSPEAFRAVTTYLGITESSDDQGAKRWTVSIQHDDINTAGSRLALFDARTRTWNARSTPPTFGNLPVSCKATPLLSRTTSEDHQAVCNHDAAALSTRLGSWLDHLPATPHVKFFRRTEWSATTLGDLDTWPRSLHFYTHLLFSQPNPAAIYWGPGLISIYNEALIPFIGEAHPVFMGSALFDVMPELVEPIGSIFQQIESLGMGIEVMEYNLPMERNNYVEEFV